MNTVKEMIFLLRNYKMSKIEVLGNPGQSNQSMSEILFNAIKENKVQTEEEAIELLYGDPDEKSNFNRFINRFKQKLINTLFFIDLNNPIFEDYNKAYYNGYRYLSAIRILMGRTARSSAVEIAERNIKKVAKYEYAELTYLFARFLARNYLIFNPDKRKYKFYHDMENTHKVQWELEMRAEDLYYDLALNFVDTKANKPELTSYARKTSEEMSKILEESKSHLIVNYVHQAYLIEAELTNDSQKTVEVCSAALELLENKSFKHKALIINFARPLISNLIKVGQLERANKLSPAYEKLSRGQPYWSFYQMSNFSLKLFRKEYLEAYKIYQKVVESSGFKFKRASHQETWKIFGAYLYFLIEMGKIKNIAKGGKMPLQNFRVGKFLNEVHTFTGDKEGGNISIIIIQVLIFLQRKEYNKLIDRTDAIIRYSSRYLRRDQNFRSNCFLQMLACLPQGDFHPARVRQLSKKYVEKLESMPLSEAPQSPDLEFIPYEHLWDYALELLGPNPS